MFEEIRRYRRYLERHAKNVSVADGKIYVASVLDASEAVP
jgi:hypothetical protein